MKRSNKRPLSFLMTISTVMLSLLGSNQTAIEPMETSNYFSVLKVITEPSINTYFDGKYGPDGMGFHLISSFAKEHNLQLEFIVTDDIDTIYSALDDGIADIAVIRQAINPDKKHSFQQSPAYGEASTQLICRSGYAKNYMDMIGKKVVVRATEENYIKYKQLKAYTADLQWEFSKESERSLLAKVKNGSIDFTIIDSMSFAVFRPHFPNLAIVADLTQPEPVTMVYSRKTPSTITRQLDRFISNAKSNGDMALLIEHFYGHIVDFDNAGYQTLSLLMQTRLPAIHNDIKTVASDFKLDWRLLAAIAYQESHWDPDARSKTGVRGLMMLTNNTAMEMGVIDRINPMESLRGGARYFKKIYKELPESVREPDRTWLALAAYNVGSGHLQDAVEITKNNNGNPDKWLNVKQSLPLLADKKWHSKTRYGYARGNEPVEYVQNIRRYYDIIESQYPLQIYEKVIPDTPYAVRTLDEAIQEKYTYIKPAKEFQVSALFF